MNKKVALHNLGCKVNAYEVEAMQQLLEAKGYEIVPFEPGADIYIINTCTVTNIADRKSRQMLHKAKKMNPQAIVVATGCYVQAAKDQLEVDPAIDLVIGNNQKQRLVSILENYDSNHGNQESVIDINKTHEYEELEIEKTAEHTRAYIKVQDGCNQFCTYCIIPFARGRVRSRKLDDVVKEVSRLAESGYQEVVLTGIHLSSYGTDFTEQPESLLSLIQAVHSVPGVKRIRLGSLEPRIITEEFARTIASLEKVCPHFHLSLQSGCDATLERMNRRYSAAEYKEKCQLLRKVYNNPALTTDVIVGFPGETQEEFEESREFVDDIAFFETHIFKYSRRNGTKAAVMENQVPDEVKTSRSHEMIAIGKRHEQEYIKQFLGQELEILVEEQLQIDGENYWVGHTREYVKAAVKSSENLENHIVKLCPTKMFSEGILY
ncbi:MAG: tRNA (N(6)-L-threonylcarbamoyladenosine(37)-C(2))-methylthiotransferase MtaB [Lachnospiraceae bacterium]|jgi:threonylcarbamoyladenosine tRNA methylthiotransferase MtaB|nr:tRNA (N(6)-L-threonylcarbamoyladenosine(37)-C(2))-methylthiotransferase MtaB [Lachnospiraceae bacterium]MDD3616467.1 tRNA (N(6)-L-threonylcarbamoyladenosine(37)-C(2))-methylthiotransferase MtaB [Lachnospiraceae bacterium]